MKITVDFTTLGFNSHEVITLQKAVDETRQLLQRLEGGLRKQFPDETFYAKLIYFDIPIRVELRATTNTEIERKFKRRLALLQGKNENGVPMEDGQDVFDKEIKEEGLL